MASKKKSGAREVIKEEDVLQAVVIADSFNIRFAPITKNIPRALMPLCNVPLLDYTLEFLCEAGIQEIIVFCCAHAEKIKAHIRNSKWSKGSSPASVRTIISEDCLSMGDALRDLDSKSIIRSDFVLVNADLISNMDLKSAIQTHKKRRDKDKSSVMTMVFKHAPAGHRSRCHEDEVIIAVDKETDQVLHYSKVGDKKKIAFPLEIFKEHPAVQLRYDLLDCQVCICSPLVAPLFSDNFDYLTRDHFVRGLLINEEILGNTIHVHVIEDDYAARVSNLMMYDAVSKDVIARWSYPLVPENNISTRHMDDYIYGRHNTYTCTDVRLSRGCILEQDVMIGPGTSVGQNSTIRRSIIGRNCKIGEDVHLDGTFIWDNVTIEDNCHITQAVLCNNAVVKRDVNIEKGCILSYDVIVGPCIKLPSRTMLMSEPASHDDSDSDDDETDLDPAATEIDPNIVGSEGKAYLYKPATGNNDEVEDLAKNMWGLTMRIEDDDDKSSGISDNESQSGDELDSDMSFGDGEPLPVDEDEDSQMFYTEVLDTLDRAEEEDQDAENIILEINSLKHAYNIAIKEVNELVVRCIGEHICVKNPHLENVQLLAVFLKLLKKWMKVLRNYIKNSEAQKHCLTGLEELCLQQDKMKVILLKVLNFLYDQEILSEEVIIHWHKTVPSTGDQAMRISIRKQVDPFVTWLEEAEEESSDDDDED
ncbi:translation initiation factor eIF2B subunit epsilon-like [Tubulanus polymorphus]|uniref:translation initiation factor eIF2B subunit epsilon-like n=1 Tax=Tubulanus polymorphus TaxID=672921 RepID=UPI003DA273EA